MGETFLERTKITDRSVTILRHSYFRLFLSNKNTMIAE